MGSAEGFIQGLLEKIKQQNEASLLDKQEQQVFGSYISDWGSFGDKFQGIVMQVLQRAFSALAFLQKDGSAQISQDIRQEDFKIQLQDSTQFYVLILHTICIKGQNSLELERKENLKLEEQQDKRRGRGARKDKSKNKQIDILYNASQILQIFNHNYNLKQLYYPSQVDNSMINQIIRVAIMIIKERVEISDDDSALSQVTFLLSQFSVQFGAQNYIAEQLLTLLDIDSNKQSMEYRSLSSAVIHVCCHSVVQHGNNRLVTQVLTFLATKYGNNEIPGVKILEEISMIVPKIVVQNISMIKNLLGHPSYQVRQTVVIVLNNLILTNLGYPQNQDVASENEVIMDDTLDQQQQENEEADNHHDANGQGQNNPDSELEQDTKKDFVKKNSQLFLTILLQRTRDKNAFVRKTVLENLCLIIKQRKYVSSSLEKLILQKATSKLKDEKMVVRVSALKLIRHVIDFSPFNQNLKSGECRRLLAQSVKLLEQAIKNMNSKNQDDMGQMGQENLPQQVNEQAKNQNDYVLQEGAKLYRNSTQKARKSVDSSTLSQLNQGIKNIELQAQNQETQTAKDNQIIQTAKQSLNLQHLTPSKILQSQEQAGSYNQENNFFNKQFKELSENPIEIYKVVQLYSHWIGLLRIVENNMDLVQEILQSKQSSDIKECIQVIQRCHYYELEGAGECLHVHLLPLIFNKDMPDIQKEVLQTFKLLYLGQDNKQESAQEMLEKLLNLINDSTLGDTLTIKQIFNELLSDNEDFETNSLLVKPLIKAGWKLLINFQDTIKSKRVQIEDFDQVGACLQFFGMVSSSQPELVVLHFQYLYIIQMLAFHSDYYDSRIIQESCDIISNLEQQFLNQDQYSNKTNQIVISALSIITMPVSVIDITEQELQASQVRQPKSHLSLMGWVPCAQAAISLVYKLLQDDALKLFDQILLDIYSQIYESDQNSDQEIILSLQCQLFYLSGEISLKRLQNIEAQTSYARKQRQIQQQPGQVLMDTDKREQEAVTDVEQQVKDQELENLRCRSEDEILSTGSIFGNLSLSLKEMAQKEDLYKTAHPMLVQSLFTCMQKFMICNKQYCEECLQIIFSILQREDVSSCLKCTVAIAIADLVQRWPNVLDPWVNQYYFKLLQQDDKQLKRNVLQTLAYVILNDMVKAKQGVAQIVVCLLDEDLHVQNQTKNFFEEYQNKNQFNKQSPMYNLFPDILSTLWEYRTGQQDQNLELTNFKNIVTYLLQFIQDEKQLQSLTERVCERFKNVQGLDQNRLHKYRCLAICLQAIKIDAKAALKVIDGYKLYKIALEDQMTLVIFKDVIKKCDDALNKKLEASKDKESNKGQEFANASSNLQEINSFLVQQESINTIQ